MEQKKKTDKVTETDLTNPREVAYRVCYQVIFQDKRLDEALEDLIRRYDAQSSEKFIRRLSKGVLERKETLDGILRKKSKIKPEHMDHPILLLLYLGIYQILYMDVENYAAVNETVKMTVQHGFSSAKNFVNAILRSVTREQSVILNGLKVWETYGVSEVLFRSLCEDYGEEKTKRVLASFLDGDTSKLYVRRNASKISENDWLQKLRKEENEAIPISENTDFPMYELKLKTTLTSSQSFQDGDFYVQSKSSVMAVSMISDVFSEFSGEVETKETTHCETVSGAETKEKLRILDLCASPGGKSLCMADLLERHAGDYEIIAADVSEKKVKMISENVSRFGFSKIHPLVSDGTKFQTDFQNRFHLVWVDGPCSGLGDLSGKPDLKLNFSASKVKSLSELQEKLLKNAAAYVVSGGTLVYSTCTLCKAENEYQVARFLETHPMFQKTAEKTYFPDEGRWDGFYVARLQRTGDEAVCSI